MRGKLKDIIYYNADIEVRNFDKKDLLFYLVFSILGTLVILLTFIFIFFWPDEVITNIFTVITIMGIIPTFACIIWAYRLYTENDVIGYINDNEISFEIVEKKELIKYTFSIKELKDIKITGERNKNLTVNLMNGKYYVLEDVVNAKKIVKTFIKIKDIEI